MEEELKNEFTEEKESVHRVNTKQKFTKPHKKNSNKLNEYKRKYYRANRDKILERNKKWREEHPKEKVKDDSPEAQEKRKASHADWQERKRKWFEENKGKVNYIYRDGESPKDRKKKGDDNAEKGSIDTGNGIGNATGQGGIS